MNISITNIIFVLLTFLLGLASGLSHSPGCRCPKGDYNPVCGSDGKTYKHPGCVSSCGGSITVVKPGPC